MKFKLTDSKEYSFVICSTFDKNEKFAYVKYNSGERVLHQSCVKQNHICGIFSHRQSQILFFSNDNHIHRIILFHREHTVCVTFHMW